MSPRAEKRRLQVKSLKGRDTPRISRTRRARDIKYAICLICFSHGLEEEVYMRKILLAAVLVLLFAASAECDQRYNAMEGRWETVPDNSNWQPKYNAMEGEWSYQPQNAQTEYNAFENKWDWDSGHNPGSDD